MKHINTSALKAGLNQYSPEILTGVGIAGMIYAVITAIKNTPKAVEAINEESEIQNKDDISVKDKIKVSWKYYIPTTLTLAASTACIIGANNISSSRYAAMLAAYELSESTYENYKNKIVETIGEEKESKIQKKIYEEQIKAEDISKEKLPVRHSDKEFLFRESFTGRLFYSTYEEIDRAVNELNYLINRNDYASVNDFLDILELDGSDIGEQYGWNVNRGLLDIKDTNYIKIDNEPCFIIEYITRPRIDYDRY